MKQFFSIIFIIELFISLTACKKNNESIPQNYRPYRYSITYDLPNPKTEIRVEYKDNFIVNIKSYTSFQDSTKHEIKYAGDTVKEVFSKKEGLEWEVDFIRVSLYSNNNISSITDYLGDTLYSKSFIYENSKLVELKSFIHTNNISTQTEATNYTYLNNKLSRTYHYKRQENSELTLNIKREFFYQNDDLSEEWIYSKKNDIPIQLTNKKLYKYEDNKLSAIEEYILENDTLKLNSLENWWFHYMKNPTLKIKYNSYGDVLTTEEIKYEEGNMNTSFYYDAFLGESIVIYKPSL